VVFLLVLLYIRYLSTVFVDHNSKFYTTNDNQFGFLKVSCCFQALYIHYKSSAVAEMGDRGHNRQGPKGGGCCAPFAERWEPV